MTELLGQMIAEGGGQAEIATVTPRADTGDEARDLGDSDDMPG
jgi:hypothetical protein